MTRIGASIAALLLLLLPAAAQAVDPRLVPDVSSRSIEIQYSFTGEELLLFGAILYPGQRLPDDRADIVVVLKGPVRPVVLREKQRIAGMWVNASSIRLRTSPGFYAIGSSRPVDKLVDERTAAIFELGLKNLSMSPTGFRRRRSSSGSRRGWSISIAAWGCSTKTLRRSRLPKACCIGRESPCRRAFPWAPTAPKPI